jgi:creatinine amidohydrolase
MRLLTIGPAAFVVAVVAFSGTAAQQPSSPAAAPSPSGMRLADATWQAAEAKLRADAVVVLPIGSGAQEHGLHLKLGNDQILAEYLSRRLAESSEVVIAPTLPYHFFPAFTEYPGSATLSLPTASSVTVDIARSLARHGPRRFLAVTSGASSVQALAESVKTLAAEGILLRYTDWRARLDGVVRKVQMQTIGSHADEIETSMMLYVDSASVEMARATREYAPPSSPFRLTRRRGGAGTYSESGVWGDATLATREKGRDLVEALVAGLRGDVEEARKAVVPVATTESPSLEGRDPVRPPGRGNRPGQRPDECLPGDDRAIRALAPVFYIAWMNQDVNRLASLWAASGDMVHPDGFVEGTAEIIRQNRIHLFARPEYKTSKHSLTFGQIRCITGEIAVADAKWEMSGLTDAKGQPVPAFGGLCTLVLKRTEGAWQIEAYRYNMNPQTPRATISQRPGG